MVLDNLGASLKATIEKITKSLFVDEKLINELVKDIQRSLLQADVNVRLVLDLTQKIKKRALETKDAKMLSKKEQLVTIVYEELAAFLGGEGSGILISKKPFRLMLVGLFGNGKTTTAGKLAKYYQKRGHKVALLSTDTWRPAAYDQLVQLGRQINVPVFGNPKAKRPEDILHAFEKELSAFDIIIIDTAGRDALNEELIDELNRIRESAHADSTLLVMAADVGQAAEKQAKAFHEHCGVTGVIISKLDGTAKGGGALTACAVTQAPVVFIGVGEKIDALEEFKPQSFVGRLLGMGDLTLLLEKVKEAAAEENINEEDLGKRVLQGDYNLIDLYQQMQAMQKMGPLGKVMELIPGMGSLKLPKEALEVQEGKLEKWKYAMSSMTKEELEDPEIIDGKRAERIAKGAGIDIMDVRSLIKQYKQSKKLIKMMGGSEKGMQKMMKKFQQGQMQFK
ncbi:MAG: signal recognition particle receptor subunit alpha [archaeon]